MRKMKNGKSPFEQLFAMQQRYQHKVTSIEKLPSDHVEWFQYHMTAMMEELGEVLKADKRWKTHRNVTYNTTEKLDELADVFISAINLAMFSGFTYEDMEAAIYSKIIENEGKI